MTRIGLLSDTHGHADRAERAVALLMARGATLLLHMGDVGSEAVLDALSVAPCRVVFGNCDDAQILSRHAEALDIVVDHPIGRLEIDGCRLAYSHGHLPELLDAALRDGVAYAIHGHTHAIRDERLGGVRVINPGALHRAPRHTVAILDPTTDSLEILDIDAPPTDE